MAFTRVVGPGIHSLSNIDSHNIHSTGIITATKFDGPFDSINVSGAATFTGSVTIGGTLTYEDVKNVDSIGVITARTGVIVGWIDQHQIRLMESADQIFATRVIHPCLPTDGGIHHRQQRCWNLNNADTSQPRGRGKSGHVSHDATAEGQHHRTAFQFERKRRVVDLRHGAQQFLLFPRLNHEHFNVVSLLSQAVKACIAVGNGNVCIADDEDFLAWLCPETTEFFAHCSQDTVTNDDVVGVALEGDVDAVGVSRRH